MAEIDEVDEQVGEAHFLERGLEGLDDGVRQLADEADRVGEEHLLLVRQHELARRGIECREELVLGKHAGASEAVQQRGFAGVRVADERGERPVVAQASLALDGAILANVLQIAFEPGDALLHAAAVHLELRFTRAARADAAALAREVRPHAREAREEVLELREFDLESAFAGAGALSEDVENELSAVEHLARGEFLEIAALRGREFVVENDGGRVLCPALAGDLLGLALADVIGRGRLFELLDDGIDDLRAGGGGEFAGVRKGSLRGPTG